MIILYIGFSTITTLISSQASCNSLNISDESTDNYIMEYYTSVNYSVEYYNSRNNLCDSIAIPASECKEGECKKSLNVSLLSCQDSSYIKALVYATNILGNGNKSDPVFIGMIMIICYFALVYLVQFSLCA